MTTEQTAAGGPAAGSAEQLLAMVPDHDGLPLSGDAGAGHFAEAARIQARLSELAEQLTALAPRPTSRRRAKSGPGAVMSTALADLKAELDALATAQRCAAGQMRALLAARDDTWQHPSGAPQSATEPPVAQAAAQTGPLVQDDDLPALQAELEQQLAAREVALAQMADRLETVTRTRDEAKALADQRLFEVQTMTAIHERGLTELEAAHTSAHKLVQARQAEIDELLGRLDMQEQQLQARETSLAQMAEELRAAAQARDEAKALVDQRLSEVQTLTAMHERGLAEVETALTKATELAEARKAEVKSVTAERDDLLDRLDAQEQQLQARETSLAQMADELRAAIQARDEAKALVDQRLSEVQTLTAMHERMLAELEAARAEVKELASVRQFALEAENAAPDDLLARLTAQEQRLKLREASLVQLAEELQATVDARDQADALAQQRANEIKTLTAMLERRSADVTAARKQVETTRKKAEAARKDADAAHKQAEEMHSLAEARQAEINGLLASRSWRITRPIRAVSSRLRFLRRV